MIRNIPFPVYIASAWLLLYIILIALDAPLKITGMVSFLSPFLITWMTLAVLKSKTTVKELRSEEEWGYADKNKEELNTF